MHDKKSFLLLGLLLIFLGSISWLLFTSHILQSDRYGNLLTGESTYGDLPFHLSEISQIAFGRVFPPENPFYAGRPLVYPYLINLLSALLVVDGVSLRGSIVWPGMFFSLVMIVSLFLFYRKLSRNKIAAFLGVLLFFLNGGLGFYYFFKDILVKGLLGKFLKQPGQFPDYSHLFGENIQWNNFLSRILVPERSVLLGIPLGVAILYLLFLRKGKQKVFSWHLLFAAFLTGLLPIAHTHSFLVLAFVIPFLSLFEVSRKNIKLWLLKWTVFGWLAFLFSLPWLLQFSQQVGGSFIRFHFGWMSKPGVINFIVFWLKNAGIFLVLVFISLFVKEIPPMVRRFTLAALMLFVIVNLFIFQPYDWDNIKILFWVGVFGSAAIATLLVHFWQKRGYVLKILSVLLFLSLTLSAAPSLYREISLQYTLFTKEEVGLGSWVRDNTDRSSVFLTAPIHKSFVNNLAGRRIFMGYPGLLWVHGIDYSEREKDLKEIFKGGGTTALLLVKDNIDYVVIGPEEKNMLGANVTFFKKNYCQLKSTTNYEIFAVKNCKIKEK